MNEKNRPSRLWIGLAIVLIGLALFIYMGSINHSQIPAKETVAPTATEEPIPAGGEAPGQPAEEPPAEDPCLPPDLPEVGIPQFPPCIPKPSTFAKISLNDLNIAADEGVQLGIIHKKIETALENDNGYPQLSIYAISNNGFTIVTQLERFNKNGTPASQDRFSTAVNKTKIFDINDYLNALFLPKDPALFRVMVFIVKFGPIIFDLEQDDVKMEEAGELGSGGAIGDLPPNIKNTDFTDEHTIGVLVYEFERTEEGEVTQREGEVLQAEVHLAQSCILDWLKDLPCIPSSLQE
jgi:hypothetical protein